MVATSSILARNVGEKWAAKKGPGYYAEDLAYYSTETELEVSAIGGCRLCAHLLHHLTSNCFHESGRDARQLRDLRIDCATESGGNKAKLPSASSASV